LTARRAGAMLPLIGKRDRPMVQVVERIERDYKVQDPLLIEVGGQGSEHLVLECGCRESFVLDGLEDRSPVGELRYSRVEDYLERLEGKEARLKYYARLEQAASL
jgi:hypothetical protein